MPPRGYSTYKTKRWTLGDWDMPLSLSPTPASRMLTALSKGEHFLWVAAVLHHLSIAECEVILVVVILRPQQANSGIIEAIRQEYSGGHGFLPPPQLHASTRRKHHRHIVMGGWAKDKDAWQGRFQCESGWSSESARRLMFLKIDEDLTIQVHPALLAEVEYLLIPQNLQPQAACGQPYLDHVRRVFLHGSRLQFGCISGDVIHCMRWASVGKCEWLSKTWTKTFWRLKGRPLTINRCRLAQDRQVLLVRPH